MMLLDQGFWIFDIYAKIMLFVHDVFKIAVLKNAFAVFMVLPTIIWIISTIFVFCFFKKDKN